MNRKIGMVSAAVNFMAVVGFACCMVLGTNYGSYLVCMFIAFSFVPMIGAFCSESDEGTKAAAYAALAFSSVYAVMILFVYFAQVTSVVLNPLNEQAAQILDYQKFGLFFNYDLLGYGIMALATFFIGLSIRIKSKVDKWLKLLLMIHGIFFFSCLIMPMLGVFKASDSAGSIGGMIALVFWCLYFAPIDILAFVHFRKRID